ncbi:MAG: tetratricopeptide repeat protein [Lysobacteraceae bacterium]|nr:MAG: tetratricopeptide repeat protein [Xanthomonadaceae bacterium]
MLLAALVTWAYWPGLSGPFLFDDYGNLNVIGANGPIRDARSLLYYLTSGNADPTGRPVALLSFLLDAQAWPADPWSFKRTNLALHVLNAGLLAAVLRRLQLGLALRTPDMAFSHWTPLVAAALWAAHPFFVSTTLYVVQREAMLPMTFVLLALLAWDRAANNFLAGHAGRAWSWTVLGVGTATLLAGLSKANGFLAPTLAGLAWLWCLRPIGPSTGRRTADRAALFCLGLPTVLLLVYLARVGLHLWSLPVLHGREWTLPERLLSEPRAIWAYVGRLVLPRAGGGGVFVDDFIASRGWLAPMTTLPALSMLAASVVASLAARRRFPVISFAWLFFLVGHLLESSVIPLELYFEHRNYLPAAMMGWPLAHALLQPGGYARYRMAFVVLLLGTFLLLTHQRAEVWGNRRLLAALSASHATDSARAQADEARQEVLSGSVDAGLARIHAALRDNPGSVDLAITAIGLECNGTGELAEDTLAQAQGILATARTWNYGLYEWMHAAARTMEMRNCRGFGLAGLASLVDAAERNPQSDQPSRKRDLRHVRGRIAIAHGQPARALGWFDAALLAAPDADYALVQAAALGQAGAPALGAQHLDHFARLEARQSPPVRDMAGLHRWLLRHDGYYARERSRLRKQLLQDAQAASE